MLTIPTSLRVFAHRFATDMRKSFNGLVGIIESELGQQVESGQGDAGPTTPYVEACSGSRVVPMRCTPQACDDSTYAVSPLTSTDAGPSPPRGPRTVQDSTEPPTAAWTTSTNPGPPSDIGNNSTSSHGAVRCHPGCRLRAGRAVHGARAGAESRGGRQRSWTLDGALLDILRVGPVNRQWPGWSVCAHLGF